MYGGDRACKACTHRVAQGRPVSLDCASYLKDDMLHLLAFTAYKMHVTPGLVKTAEETVADVCNLRRGPPAYISIDVWLLVAGQ